MGIFFKFILVYSLKFSKSIIDQLHAFPNRVMREYDGLDQILTIDDLIEKCEYAENLKRQTRKEKLKRFFADIESINQVSIQKAKKTASNWKIQRVKMAFFDKDIDSLVLSVVACECEECMKGNT